VARSTRLDRWRPWVVAAHGAVCLGLLAAVLWLDVPYSAVVFLAGPVLLASAYFPQRVYLAMTPPAAAAGLAAVLLRAPDRQEALVAFLGLAVTVAGTSELLFRLGVSHRAAQEQLRRRAALPSSAWALSVGPSRKSWSSCQVKDWPDTSGRRASPWS
jgi:hypothetical protein